MNDPRRGPCGRIDQVKVERKARFIRAVPDVYDQAPPSGGLWNEGVRGGVLTPPRSGPCGRIDQVNVERKAGEANVAALS